MAGNVSERPARCALCAPKSPRHQEDDPRFDRDACVTRSPAEELRCHRLPEPITGRCYLHGGTTKRGPAHPNYKHGLFSQRYTGILASAGRAYDAVQELSTLRSALAINASLLDHKLGEVLAAGPSDATWLEVGRLTTEIERVRDSGDRKRMAALLNTRDELIKTQCSSVRARREVDGLLNTQRKLVDTEERRKDRADVTVSITTFLGFFDMLVEVVRTHVTDPEQRAAIGKALGIIYGVTHSASRPPESRVLTPSSRYADNAPR